MKCNICGKEFNFGYREDGTPNGVTYMTKQGILTMCADCIIEIGKQNEKPQTEQTDCAWK